MDKNYKNIISVRGTIVSIHTDMRKTTMRIATDGGSGKGLDSEDKSYYPEIVFYTTNIGERFSVRRDHVEIKAHIHTWYNRNEKKNVTEYVGDSIVRTSRFLADYFSNIDEEGANPDDENIVILSGKVSRIDKRDSGGNLVVLSISIPDKEKRKTIDILFDLLSASGAATLTEVRKGKLKVAISALPQMLELPKETRDIIIEFLILVEQLSLRLSVESRLNKALRTEEGS